MQQPKMLTGFWTRQQPET